jgi:hypothetical protein
VFETDVIVMDEESPWISFDTIDTYHLYIEGINGCLRRGATNPFTMMG